MAQTYSQTDCCVVICTQSHLAAMATNKARTTTEIAVACLSEVPLQRSVSQTHTLPPDISLQPLSKPVTSQLRDTISFPEKR